MCGHKNTRTRKQIKIQSMLMNTLKKKMCVRTICNASSLFFSQNNIRLWDSYPNGQQFDAHTLLGRIFSIEVQKSSSFKLEPLFQSALLNLRWITSFTASPGINQIVAVSKQPFMQIAKALIPFFLLSTPTFTHTRNILHFKHMPNSVHDRCSLVLFQFVFLFRFIEFILSIILLFIATSSLLLSRLRSVRHNRINCVTG